jgi:deazaflavin-dependent oxidoreductase (nitroreductase family)
MTKRFQMTGAMRIATKIPRTLLYIGLPLGPLALLSVQGRKTGKIYTTPIALVETNGIRWLVAAFGEVSWVHNLRSNRQAHLVYHGRTEAIEVVEINPVEAAPILKQFLAKFHIVPFIPPYFDARPNSPIDEFEREAQHHPVFRISSTNGKE